ncbi:MAG: hypothetical protein ACOZE5_11955 [Verrucomicrobiota bacterium]
MIHPLRRHFDLGLDPLLAGDAAAGSGEAVPSPKTRELNGLAAAGIGAAAVRQEDLRTRALVTVLVLLCLIGALWLLQRWRARKQRACLQGAAWLFIALGIFFRQNLDLKTLHWTLAHFDAGAFLVSLVIALAIFPWAMRTSMRGLPRMRSLSLNLIAVPFMVGFFLDLARLATVWLVLKI